MRAAMCPQKKAAVLDRGLVGGAANSLRALTKLTQRLRGLASRPCLNAALSCSVVAGRVTWHEQCNGAGHGRSTSHDAEPRHR